MSDAAPTTRNGASNGRDAKGRFAPGNKAAASGKSIASILEAIGAEYLDKYGMTKQQYVMNKVYIEAMKGQQWAVNFIADRTEGKPVQRNENLNRTLPELTIIDVE